VYDENDRDKIMKKKDNDEKIKIKTRRYMCLLTMTTPRAHRL